jgi:hypothetical protein
MEWLPSSHVSKRKSVCSDALLCTCAILHRVAIFRFTPYTDGRGSLFPFSRHLRTLSFLTVPRYDGAMPFATFLRWTSQQGIFIHTLGEIFTN